MKKKYSKPEIEIEGFVPNEYVALCGTVTIPGANGAPDVSYEGAITMVSAESYIDYTQLDDNNDQWPDSEYWVDGVRHYDMSSPVRIIRGTFFMTLADGSKTDVFDSTHLGDHGAYYQNNINTGRYGDGCFIVGSTPNWENYHYHISNPTNHS